MKLVFIFKVANPDCQQIFNLKGLLQALVSVQVIKYV